MATTTERSYVMKDCPDCHGDGKVLGMRGYPGTGAGRPVVECRRCAGTGRVRKNPPRKPKRAE